jgi:signal transduction histidine kinase
MHSEKSRKTPLLGKNILVSTLLSAATAISLLYLDGTEYRIPSSPGIFATVIMLIAFHFGLIAGLISAFIAVSYTAIHFSAPDNIFFYPQSQDRVRVIMWGVIFPLQGILIGLLKERLLKKIDAEEALRQQLVVASRLAATGEMAAGIAHEINTPLCAIALNAEMILMENDSLSGPNAGISKRANSIIEIGHRISKIIDGLKGFSRDARQDEKQVFSIESLMTTTLSLCNERFQNNGVQVTVLKDHLDTQVYGQIIQLSQVLLNLLNNSFDAIQEQNEKWIRIEVALTDPTVEIRLTDSGRGIKKEIRDKMFNPFFTTKDIGKGTGLGLSISFGIVQNHGGRLYYDEQSQNTRFVICLPIAQIGRAGANDSR